MAAPIAVRFALEGPVGAPLVSPKLLPIGHDGPYIMRSISKTLAVVKPTYEICSIEVRVAPVFLRRQKSHVTSSRFPIWYTEVCRDFRAVRRRSPSDRATAGLDCLTDSPATPFVQWPLRMVSACNAK
jgi:hypothetical protein